MRLWHKDLIPVLPDKQLLGQWRECCAIARNISVNGTPNHILVNKVMEYEPDHLFTYGMKIAGQMSIRGFYVDTGKFIRYFPFGGYEYISNDDLFKDWHNRRYLLQCIYNLQEKYDCNGISDEEWGKLLKYFESVGVWL